MSARTKRLVLAAFLLTLAVVALIAVVQAIVAEVGSADGIDAAEDGALVEAVVARPDSLPLPVFTEVAELWGLDGWNMEGETNMRGGVAAGDINGDGLVDLAVAGGPPAVWLNTGAGFRPMDLPASVMGDATAVTIADLDGSGTNELLFGYQDGPVRVVGTGGRERTFGEGGFTTGIVVADVTNDGDVDVIRSVYGQPDMVFPNPFTGEGDPMALPKSAGLSMVASVFDANGDGQPDIWVTRDVGWAEGSDAVYTFDAENEGFVEIGASLGAASEVDGMGITAADFSGDGVLDVYISDIGDNELLLGVEAGIAYGPAAGASAAAGLARIRPPGSPVEGDAAEVSSSWGSGATDINHDGVLDLIVVNGGFAFGEIRNKIDGTQIALDDPPAIFLGLGDGTFTDAWAESWSAQGLDVPLLVASRGMALADFDGDNDTDIVIANFAGGLTVLRNDTPGPVTRIVGDGCVGTRIEVTGDGVSALTVIGAQSFLGHHSPEVAIGAASSVQVQVDGLAPLDAASGSILDVSDLCRRPVQGQTGG